MYSKQDWHIFRALDIFDNYKTDEQTVKSPLTVAREISVHELTLLPAILMANFIVLTAIVHNTPAPNPAMSPKG
ncbi:hypothetical protein [Paraburkholderia sp. J67]|uniref:hypothetical protein n=1 Tax=Paraburkholderia sp. J67 TaxID=2805435 RepID=UPI002ABD3721|nr:hypothetical protein [Paraburkholderia sp. J67]